MGIAEQTKKGHKFIKVSFNEMTGPLRGLGICDSCCKAMFEGYLIPVLNSAYCKECFDEWQERAAYYKESLTKAKKEIELMLKSKEKGK